MWRLRLAREAQARSRAEWAAEARLSESVVSELEAGRAPTLRELALLSEATGWRPRAVARLCSEATAAELDWFGVSE